MKRTRVFEYIDHTGTPIEQSRGLDVFLNKLDEYDTNEAKWLKVDTPLESDYVIGFAGDWKLSTHITEIYYCSIHVLMGKMDLFHEDGVFFVFRKRKITFASVLTNLILYKLPNIDRVAYIRSIDHASICAWLLIGEKFGICKDIQHLVAKWIRTEPFIIDEYTNPETYQEYMHNKRHAYYRPRKRTLNNNYWLERECYKNINVVLETKRDIYGNRWWKNKAAGKNFFKT